MTSRHPGWLLLRLTLEEISLERLTLEEVSLERLTYLLASNP